MLVKVIFITTGGNPVLGDFSAGDSARVSQRMAEHLVNEAKCAIFAPADPVAPEAPPTKRTLKLKGRKC